VNTGGKTESKTLSDKLRQGTHTQGAYDVAHVMYLYKFPLMIYIKANRNIKIVLILWLAHGTWQMQDVKIRVVNPTGNLRLTDPPPAG
jgi:hypothetical protein